MPSSGVSPTAALNQRNFLHIIPALERALTIATMRMGAHLALGASVHITQNTTTTITTAHMGARLERARTSPPLRTMTKRDHQHHCTRTLTASSSIGVHACHGTTHKDGHQQRTSVRTHNRASQ